MFDRLSLVEKHANDVHKGECTEIQALKDCESRTLHERIEENSVSEERWEHLQAENGALEEECKQFATSTLPDGTPKDSCVSFACLLWLVAQAKAEVSEAANKER